MGLFDFFKHPARKKGKSGDKAERPRCAHYLFAHVVLRQMALHHPYMTMGALGSAQGKAFLADLLATVEEQCAQLGGADTLTADQVRFHPGKARKYPCTIVEFPAPQVATEVFFVAMVLKPPTGDAAADLLTAEMRYFTLELGARREGKPRTVLCEWSHDGAHLNYGEGPPPDIDKFRHAVAALCE